MGTRHTLLPYTFLIWQVASVVASDGSFELEMLELLLVSQKSSLSMNFEEVAIIQHEIVHEILPEILPEILHENLHEILHEILRMIFTRSCRDLTEDLNPR